MQYDLVIKRTLREAQGILRANLPPANKTFAMLKRSNLSGPSYARHKCIRRWSGATTPLFASYLRAVNCILSDEDQPNTTINQLWDVLDQPELNRALMQNSRMILGQKKPPTR